ncbi:hypothetical protein [Thauera sp. SDU_THAU2]|uniref:hypothetical protein n=1 Tax=Thauera sp. SDU_THAU2 TaxID=3136633 RepID=UPI00311EBBDC
MAISRGAGQARANAASSMPDWLHPADSTAAPPDIVQTWADAHESAWRDLVSPYKDIGRIDPDRFEQTDGELKYSLRSVAFRPWARRIHIFSNCAPPDWFRETDRIRWVRHEEVVAETHLPLFNSHAIETFLYEIPGLTENFIYFNDDFFLSAPSAAVGFPRPMAARWQGWSSSTGRCTISIRWRKRERPRSGRRPR